jgi:butyrate kinase
MLNFKSSFIAAALVVASMGASVSVSAQTATPVVDQREANQQARIAQGAASGQLTPRETRRLERQQARINRAETHAKADGKVTKHERKHLRHMQKKASRNIYHQKHDAQVSK